MPHFSNSAQIDRAASTLSDAVFMLAEWRVGINFIIIIHDVFENILLPTMIYYIIFTSKTKYKNSKCKIFISILKLYLQEKVCQEYGLYCAVAGLMLANKDPVSAWNPVRGPKNMKITYP